jgi:hypothetical protein
MPRPPGGHREGASLSRRASSRGSCPAQRRDLASGSGMQPTEAKMTFPSRVLRPRGRRRSGHQPGEIAER